MDDYILPFGVVDMPLDAQGRGPADKAETVKVQYELLDDNFQTGAICDDFGEAKKLADRINKAFPHHVFLTLTQETLREFLKKETS